MLQGKGSNLHEAVSPDSNRDTKFSGRQLSFLHSCKNGSMIRLSCYPHPVAGLKIFLKQKSLRFSTKAFFKCCRGRARTFTRQLAIVQSSVVDPGRSYIAAKTALCYVCPVILTPETRGHVCQKFHHPTVYD